MKSIKLLLLMLLLNCAAFAQITYDVSVCGNVAGLNGGTTSLDLSYSGDGQVTLTSTITDSLGNYCFNITIPADSGIYAFTDIYITHGICFVPVTYTLGNLWISSDTAFTLDMVICTDPNNSGTCYNAAQVDTLAACPAVYAPVCGCDGITYSNSCEAYYRGVATWTSGLCNFVLCSVLITEESTPVGDIYLLAESTGIPPFTYEWSNGETTSSILPDTLGAYCVSITDSSGCSSSACYSFGNSGSCSVYFYSYPAPILPPGPTWTYYFSSFPYGLAPFTYSWTFSDGGTDTAANPVHTFAPTGGWDWAYLEVSDANGCVSYYTDYVFLDDSTVTQSCYADFGVYIDNASGVAGQAYFYDYSFAPTGITSWTWDFGDGSTSTDQYPTHLYTSAGDYTICLTITEYSGCISTACWTYYIDPYWWINNPGGGGNACEANFVATQDSSLAGLVYLVDLSYGSHLAYSWDFGNGTIINDQYPYITFNNDGWVYACLTVTDTLTGCSDTHCDTVAVDENGILRDGSISWSINVMPGVFIQFGGSSGVEENMEAGHVAMLYPNPVNTMLNLQVLAEAQEEVNIDVLDVTGKLVRSSVLAVNKGENIHRMNIESLADGVYFVKITSAGINETLRFVKN